MGSSFRRYFEPGKPQEVADMPEFGPIYRSMPARPITGIMIAEAIYLLYAGGSDRRAAINRRMKLQKTISQEQVLIQLRKERGLEGGVRRSSVRSASGRCATQSGLVTPMPRFLTITSGIAVALPLAACDAAAAGSPRWRLPSSRPSIPLIVLRFLRSRRHSCSASQLPRRSS